MEASGCSKSSLKARPQRSTAKRRRCCLACMAMASCWSSSSVAARFRLELELEEDAAAAAPVPELLELEEGAAERRTRLNSLGRQGPVSSELFQMCLTIARLCN